MLWVKWVHDSLWLSVCDLWVAPQRRCAPSSKGARLKWKHIFTRNHCHKQESSRHKASATCTWVSPASSISRRQQALTPLLHCLGGSVAIQTFEKQTLQWVLQPCWCWCVHQQRRKSRFIFCLEEKEYELSSQKNIVLIPSCGNKGFNEVISMQLFPLKWGGVIFLLTGQVFSH